MTLLTDNRMEILYKAGQMNLFLRFLERKYGIDKYWTYVKICLRHDYVIHDADLWLDYVDMLIENNNSEFYNILGVEQFAEYITACLADMAIHVVCSVLIFILSYVLIRFLIYCWI